MKKTMKRRAFISAIAMLIVSAIVLTSSTFAWFSIAKEAQVSPMNLNITTADGISISANVHKFGTTVTTDDIIPADGVAGKNLAADADHTNNIPELLAPASSTFALASGYPTFFKGSVGESKQVSVTKITDERIGCFVVFDLFVQVSNNNQTVKLAGTTISSDDANVIKALRLGLVNCGYKEYAQKDAAKTITTSAAANTAMWIVDGNSSDATKYIAPNANGALATTDGFAIAYIGNTAAGTVATATNASDLTFVANKGVNRIRFYLWVEGQDADCTNDIAGGNFDFNLKLSID